ncbi:glycerophosphodiester phosphodiesterase family protein [Compostimonas suwonensis]|uniref:Glycerophosphoryl diester phosphodiesterase n=1 Tax=Compostimonas suwonensis TaxID=1048394 RepID=A0A2M9BYW1_9MICO|nr:glycerophosphodiester phosphodiesterase family protein [Compostimonas suwonensis]PJJ63256.1 glycerophosphoryl diester phosphodiesterase [Compostimonas suwonensis]
MPDRLRSGFFAPPLPRIFAHRGLAHDGRATDAAENTLEAFARALAAGATHLETDVHASADGESVISHDPDFAGADGRRIVVASLTVAELQARRDVPPGSFRTLREALDAFPGARFNIDVKSDAAAGPTAQAIRALAAVDRVLVTSFDDARRRAAVDRLPGVATSASSRTVARALLLAVLGAQGALRRTLADVDAVQIPQHVAGVRIVTRRTVRAFHEAGVEVHVWTVDDPREMALLLDRGVDGLVTDRCDLASRLVASRAG